MEQDRIINSIREHLAGRGIEPADVTAQARLADDLGLDSLDTVELTLALEQEFEIEIPDSELEDLETVADAVQLIEGKIAAKV